jgi:o-succinylbenzoate synthase
LRGITIADVVLVPIALPQVEPLTTSYGVEPFKSAVLVEVITSDGISGWGEVSVDITPGYGPETMVTALHILRSFLIPLLRGESIAAPWDVPRMLHSVRGHRHAKAGLEAAVWDAYARTNSMSLATLFRRHLKDESAPRDSVEVGVSIGIQPDADATLSVIATRRAQGYDRIKLKIRPGHDVEIAYAVRQEYPDVPLMLDANSAYTLADASLLGRLDAANLMMLEQPLAYNDMVQHSRLRQLIRTPICLDESVTSAADFELALAIGALDILNLKPARVGGFTEALAICRMAGERGIPLWVGGMMETGIGRAASLALAAMPAVTLPSDLSATDRYFAEDITEPAFHLVAGSRIPVPQGPGIGVDVQRDRVEAASVRWEQAVATNAAGGAT